MTEYRHFIAYIYEYQNGNKLKNAGFVKVNIRNGIGRMKIKIKTDPKTNEPYGIYGFVHEGEWIYGILLGNVVIKNGLYEGILTVPETVFQQKGYGFGELGGLWIERMGGTEREEKEYFLTIWDERSAKWEKFVTELPEKEDQTEQNYTETDNTETDNAEEEDTEEVIPEKEITVQEAEAPVCGENIELDGRWAQFQYHYPHITPFEDEEITECIQIAPKDIAFLGEQERIYCSSPFIQQKYMKYHHLLLGKHQNGRYLLAVPGLNRNVQDRNLAAMYGFPEFKKTGAENGYWYHFLNF